MGIRKMCEKTYHPDYTEDSCPMCVEEREKEIESFALVAKIMLLAFIALIIWRYLIK